MCLKRLKINSNIILKKTWFLFTILCTIFGFLSMFITVNLFTGKSFWCGLLLSFLIFLGVFILIFIVSTTYVLIKKRTKIFTSDAGHVVSVRFGDILNYGKEGEKYNIVIPVNCCFDTLVDNDLISYNSLHGKVVSNLYAESIYTRETLDLAIQKSLSDNRTIEVELLSKVQKRKGKLKRYEVGSIVEIKKDEFSNYFMLALTKIDKNLSAYLTKEDFGLAIQRLIEYSKLRSQGYPIVLPLIGTGLSKLGLSKQKILNYLVSILKINENNLCCDFHIVILERDRDDITLYL